MYKKKYQHKNLKTFKTLKLYKYWLKLCDMIYFLYIPLIGLIHSFNIIHPFGMYYGVYFND
jgi:hypothetical protein